MKLIQKPVWIGVGIFAASILVTGMLNRYMISKTNEISRNVVDVPAQETKYVAEPEKAPLLPEKPSLEVVSEVQTEKSETEQLFEAELPVSGGVMTGYTGDKPVFSKTLKDYRTHPGIDIYGAVGETVKAIEKGTVQSVYEDIRYGQTVVIEHRDGYVSRYANLDRSGLIKAGDSVLKGQAIGVVGESALIEQSEAPHLHFELFKDNVAVDPETYLPF